MRSAGGIDLAETGDPTAASPGDAEPLVEARALVKAYTGEPVVRGIDFDVRRGECLGILGPNGAGKTTTIHMITCFVDPTEGRLEVFGHPVGEEPRAIKSRLGVVSQENNLDPDLTVRKNLLVYGRYFGLSRRRRRERAAELLEFVQLDEKADDPIRSLSGGMRRRLTLARALISTPELLILDEPTTGLDPQARHVVWQKLRALNRAGMTMLLTTHYMEEAAQLCDRLLIMDHGRIIAEGAPEALIEEHIGAEAIEIFPRRGEDGEGSDRSAAVALLATRADHVERAGDEVYGFFRDPEAARSLLPELGELDVLHRRATLEDVFLKLTGRELRE
ncbi:MAG: ATP-binding cassette domain-containing protein [Gemmatimonadota bacterium]|nr:ATP-binding cassette domain-containing protein [Gemmatimonadota bacterium]